MLEIIEVLDGAWTIASRQTMDNGRAGGLGEVRNRPSPAGQSEYYAYFYQEVVSQ